MTDKQPAALLIAATLEAFDMDGAADAVRRLHASHQHTNGNVALLADILNRRPAMNAGLVEAYAAWTAEVYNLMGAMAAAPANDADRAMRAAQQDSFDHGPQATSIEEAVRDVGKWLNERPNRPIDLRHVAMLCAHAKAAHQQEAQEPVAWMTQEGDRVTTAKTMNAARRDGGAMLTSLRSYSVALVRAAAQEGKSHD